MKKVLPWVLSVVLIVGAWFLAKAALPDDAAQAPFVTVATIGEPADSRNLLTTITDVRAAQRVTDSKGWSAEGTWLVVDLEAQTQVTSEPGTLSFVQLIIGDRTFTATDRGTTFYKQLLVVGVPRSGSIAFELPADALSGTATLRLTVPSGADTEALDGMIELPIDLDELSIEPDTTLAENGWAR